MQKTMHVGLTFQYDFDKRFGPALLIYFIRIIFIKKKTMMSCVNEFKLNNDYIETSI